MKRYSESEFPNIGDVITISPIKSHTSSLQLPDTKHHYYGKNITGIVISDNEYNEEKKKGDVPVKFEHLVPIKTKDSIILTHPSFCISNAGEKEGRCIFKKETIIETIRKRILELT